MISRLFILPFIFLIRVYQLMISPIIGSNCRYLPTCSEYSIESFKSFGLIKGLYLTIKRIGKCHPLGGHGYDPIPSTIERNKK